MRKGSCTLPTTHKAYLASNTWASLCSQWEIDSSIPTLKAEIWSRQSFLQCIPLLLLCYGWAEQNSFGKEALDVFTHIPPCYKHKLIRAFMLLPSSSLCEASKPLSLSTSHLCLLNGQSDHFSKCSRSIHHPKKQDNSETFL